MALKVTQKVTSRQLDREPKELVHGKGVAETGRQLQSQVTPFIPAPVDTKVLVTSDTYHWTITRTDATVVKGRSVAPLISPAPQFEVNGFRLSEKVHGWGGYSVVFLDLHPVLDAAFRGLNKWIFGASSGRWRLDENRINNYKRWVISIEGINQ